jgi:hypothetical protein
VRRWLVTLSQGNLRAAARASSPRGELGKRRVHRSSATRARWSTPHVMYPLLAQVISAEERHVGVAAEFPHQRRDLVGAELVICPLVAFGIVIELGLSDC